MIYKDFCIQPENELDEEFIDSEIKFLLEVSVHKQREIKNELEYTNIIKNHYKIWLENHGRSKTNYSH